MLAGRASRQSPVQRLLLDRLMASRHISSYILWYYTPLALAFSSHLRPAATVYDCMDELSAFKGAPAELPTQERVLLRRADVVFTGGQSLYEAKQHQHGNIHAIPSSVDVRALRRARASSARRPAGPAPICRARASASSA